MALAQSRALAGKWREPVFNEKKPTETPAVALASERRASPFDQTLFPVQRSFDHSFNAYAINVPAGVCTVTGEENEMLVAILGSCVGACIRDPESGWGGMNHFMLPGGVQQSFSGNSFALRYGHFAMEKLINDVLSRGARRDQLEIKLFGGASLLHAPSPIGDENIAFMRHYLKAEGLAIASEDLGGPYPRRIHYFPKTGKVFRLLMRRSDDAQVFSEEKIFRDKLRQDQVEGAVSIF
jgi:chemotaxis protein CheD